MGLLSGNVCLDWSMIILTLLVWGGHSDSHELQDLEELVCGSHLKSLYKGLALFPDPLFFYFSLIHHRAENV